MPEQRDLCDDRWQLSSKTVKTCYYPQNFWKTFENTPFFPKISLAISESLSYDFASSAHRHAPVAQLDRVLDYESSGWRFESSRARHFPKVVILIVLFLNPLQFKFFSFNFCNNLLPKTYFISRKFVCSEWVVYKNVIFASICRSVATIS